MRLRRRRAGRWRARSFDAVLRAFRPQPEEYREEVLPNDAANASRSKPAYPRSGINMSGSMERSSAYTSFGLSAPGTEVMKELGIDAQHVIDAAKRSLRVSRALTNASEPRLGSRLARAIFEAGELFQERQRNFAHRAVALFGDDQFGFARLFRARFFVFLVNLRPDEQSDQIRILFDGAGFAQIAQARLAASALLPVVDSTAPRR